MRRAIFLKRGRYTEVSDVVKKTEMGVGISALSVARVNSGSY